MKPENLKVRDCVGCGFCCIKAPCELSRRIYDGASTSCPALIWNKKEQRYYCDLVLSGPRKEEYSRELYIAEGCCCGLNSWRNDIQPRRDKDFEKPIEFKPLQLEKIFVEFLNSLAKQFISGDVFYLTLFGMKEKLIQLGYNDNQIKNIMKSIEYHFNENRNSRIKNFMG